VYVNPDECIDCGVCVPECPIDAIVPDNDDNIDAVFWTDLNKRLSAKWPNITVKKSPLPDAETWNGVENKLEQLEE
jgi:ferredoxin